MTAAWACEVRESHAPSSVIASEDASAQLTPWSRRATRTLPMPERRACGARYEAGRLVRSLRVARPVASERLVLAARRLTAAAAKVIIAEGHEAGLQTVEHLLADKWRDRKARSGRLVGRPKRVDLRCRANRIAAT
eukprot:scaffold41606_cov72-Phaeocystis_antarctica.AAC.5